MDSNIVFDMVRRSNRRLLILGIIGIIAIAVGIFLDRQQLFSFVSGPRKWRRRNSSRCRTRIRWRATGSRSRGAT